MLKAVVYLILTVSLVSVKAPVPIEKQILTTLMNNFARAYPHGGQFAVLYLHRDVANAAPEYDVSDFCGAPPNDNFIRQTIANWANPAQGAVAQAAQRVEKVSDITDARSPVWPTSLNRVPNLSHCRQHEYGLHYPNIATAGIIRDLKKNSGHSEYLLHNKVISTMLLSYTTAQRQCPGAAFLYTNLSPCSSCADEIIKMAMAVRTTRVDGKQCQGTPFYLGYTNEYRGGKRDAWVEIREKLEGAGITIFDKI